MLQKHRRVKLENPLRLCPSPSLPFSPTPHPSEQFFFLFLLLAVIILSVFVDKPKEITHSFTVYIYEFGVPVKHRNR
jgi:hypothetical protein